jgi:hypothetical protein
MKSHRFTKLTSYIIMAIKGETCHAEKNKDSLIVAVLQCGRERKSMATCGRVHVP